MKREEAKQLLHQLTDNASLLRHARTVELVMQHYAQKLNQDQEEWAITGILHDADYQRHPDQHPNIIVNKLKDLGEENIAYAISAHYTKWQVPQTNLLDKALLACDELTGFIVACSQVRPEKLNGLKARSVIKKLKQKSFAAKVDREEVRKGVELFEVDLSEHIDFIIGVLQQHQVELALA